MLSKMGHPGLMSFIFDLFQTNIKTIYTAKKFEKMPIQQHIELGFEPTTFRLRVLQSLDQQLVIANSGVTNNSEI